MEKHTVYTVNKDGDQFTAHQDGALIGRRPKYKAAQRLCEQQAGQALDWRSLGGGAYEAVR